MDDKRFDQITRALTGSSGRREAIKTIFGSGVASALGALGLAEAEAKKGKTQGAGKDKSKKHKQGSNQAQDQQGGQSKRGKHGKVSASSDITCSQSDHPAVCRNSQTKCVGNCNAALQSGDCLCPNQPSTQSADCKPPSQGGLQKCPADCGATTCTLCSSEHCCSDSDCSNGKVCNGQHQCVIACTRQSCPSGCCENGACNNDKKRCGQQCIDKSACCTDADCSSPGVCQVENSGKCNTNTHTCSYDTVPDGGTCTPNKSSVNPKGKGKNAHTAGTDGGGVCCGGDCFAGECCTADQCKDPDKPVCNGDHQCVSNCTPNCAGKDCGDNGCGGSCGTCPGGQTCNNDGKCVCTPNCTGKDCGDNGCGGSCGTCPGGQTCNNDGKCVCNLGACQNNNDCTCPDVTTCGTFGDTQGQCCRTKIGVYCKPGETGSGCCGPAYVCASPGTYPPPANGGCQCNTDAGFVQDGDKCICPDGNHVTDDGKCVPNETCVALGQTCNACHQCCEGSVCTDPEHACDGSGGVCKCPDGTHESDGKCVPDTCVQAGDPCNSCHQCCDGSICTKPDAPCTGPGDAGVCLQCVAIDQPCSTDHPCCHPDKYHCTSDTADFGTCVENGPQCVPVNGDCSQNPCCNPDQIHCDDKSHICVPNSTCLDKGEACTPNGTPCCNGICTDGHCPTGGGCTQNCDPNQCLFCNSATGQCISPCGANTTCKSGQCVGGGGATCDATHCSPNLCLMCNSLGQCVPKCPGQTCDANGNCVNIPSGCTSDEQCGLGGICLNGICFVTSTCPAGESNLKCCYNAVKKACRHRGGTQPGHGGGGHLCRVKGKKRCRTNFGNT